MLAQTAVATSTVNVAPLIVMISDEFGVPPVIALQFVLVEIVIFLALTLPTPITSKEIIKYFDR